MYKVNPENKDRMISELRGVSDYDLFERNIELALGFKVEISLKQI